MRSARELHGLAVVDIQGGKRLGHIDEVVISPDDLRLLGFVLKQGNLLSHRERIVEVESVHSIGADAVTIASEDVVREADAAGDPFREARSGERRLAGAKVVTEEGKLLGIIDDFSIDESQQRVAALTLRGGLFSGGDALPAERIVSVGPDVVVVRGEGVEPRHEDAALGGGRDDPAARRSDEPMDGPPSPTATD